MDPLPQSGRGAARRKAAALWGVPAAAKRRGDARRGLPQSDMPLGSVPQGSATRWIVEKQKQRGVFSSPSEWMRKSNPGWN